MTQSAAASISDRLALGYQLKIHLMGISPQVSLRVLVRGDTTLAELQYLPSSDGLGELALAQLPSLGQGLRH